MSSKFYLSSLITATTLLVSSYYVASLSLKYIEHISQAKFGREIDARYIRATTDLWIPATVNDAVNKFMLNDYWSEGRTVPMFRNNKFVIRYTLFNRTDFNANQRNILSDALNAIEKNTCLKFWEIEDAYVPYSFPRLAYDKFNNCHSETGFYSGETTISIGHCYGGASDITHETMHALGFDHEHNRPDRDLFITLNHTNIPRKLRRAFKKNSAPLPKFGMDYKSREFYYDYYSIMHYRSRAGAIHWEYRTIIPKCNVNISLVGGEELSERDINKLQFYYGCHRYKFLVEALKTVDKFFFYDHDDSFGYRENANGPKD